jgi:hypothetical protein
LRLPACSASTGLWRAVATLLVAVGFVIATPLVLLVLTHSISEWLTRTAPADAKFFSAAIDNGALMRLNESCEEPVADETKGEKGTGTSQYETQGLLPSRWSDSPSAKAIKRLSA